MPLGNIFIGAFDCCYQKIIARNVTAGKDHDVDADCGSTEAVKFIINKLCTYATRQGQQQSEW